ncbi:MAG: glycosyltransferase family 39 protein [Thermodesulfobacteriota bacterium]
MSERSVWVLLCVILAIRVVTLPLPPLTDNTEARYGIIVREMANSGDWITPRVWMNGKLIPYLGKPPLHFWAAVLSTRLFGMNEFALRFPSLVGAFFLVTLMVFVLRRYVDRDLAFRAALILSTCILFFMLAGAVVVDMSLAFCVAGAILSYQAFLLETTRVRKRLWSLCIFTFLGLGFLIKGPIAVVMFGIPVFLWTLIHRRWNTLKNHGWWIGILVFLTLTIPWFWLAENRNPGFLKYFFLNENLLRFVTHRYGDLYGSGRKQPYGAAVGMLFLAGLPWTLWCAILLFRRHRWKWLGSFFKDERTSLFTFGLVGMTLFLCFAHQLVMPYVLPILPFFAIWGAIFMERSGLNRATMMRFSIALVILYGIVHPLALPLVEKKFSTKGIVKLARDKIDHLGLDSRLIFVHNIPYSAYFYGQDLIIPHENEGTEFTVLQRLNSGKDHLYAVKRKYLSEIPPSLLDKLTPIGTFGDWTLYRAK